MNKSEAVGWNGEEATEEKLVEKQLRGECLGIRKKINLSIAKL